MIDIQAAGEAYGKQEISDIGRITSEENPADGFKKASPWAALERLLETGRLNVPIQHWVVRTLLCGTNLLKTTGARG